MFCFPRGSRHVTPALLLTKRACEKRDRHIYVGIHMDWFKSALSVEPGFSKRYLYKVHTYIDVLSVLSERGEAVDVCKGERHRTISCLFVAVVVV